MKNRRIANITLIGVALLFGAVLVWRYVYSDTLVIKALYTILEAALVGGLADWFAITALFEKPLGFPWHTAIIPRNRTKIIDGLAATVENELLSKASIRERLAGVHTVRLFVTWIEEKNGKKALAEIAAGYIRKLIISLNARQCSQALEQILKNSWQELYIAPLLSRIVKLFLQKDEKLIDFLLNEIIKIISTDKTRAAIYEILEKYSNKIVDTWWKQLLKNVLEAVDAVNLAEAAAAVQANILSELNNIKQPSHPLRVLIRSEMSILADRMQNDASMAKTIKEWQIALSERVKLGDILTELLELALAWERRSIAESGQSQVVDWLFVQLSKYWEMFKKDNELQDWLEKYIKEALNEVIESEHNLVSTITKNALYMLTDKKLAEFIDEKAGEDLQWIRINGSVVGGIVGLMLFLFLHFIYDPYVVPVLRGILH